MIAKKPRLLELIQIGYVETLHFLCSLSEADRNETGTLEHWSPKDTLVHISAWKERIADRIEAALEGIPPPQKPGYDAINADIFTRYHSSKWEEVEIMVEQSHQKLLAQVGRLSEEDLVDPARFPWRVKHPFLRIIAGNAFLHPFNHLTQAYIRKGLTEEALRLQAQYQVAADLDDSPSWQGLILYDQACNDVLLNEKNAALKKFEAALHLDHDLVEWLKRDSSLALLHDDPDFQLMLARLEIELPSGNQEF